MPRLPSPNPRARHAWRWIALLLLAVVPLTVDDDRASPQERVWPEPVRGDLVSASWVCSLYPEQHRPPELDAAPYPNRRALPVDGPARFRLAVERVLSELRQHAPTHYQEVLHYLPRARFDPAATRRYVHDAAAIASGEFAIDDTSYGYAFFRFVLLHEVGHNVLGDFVHGDFAAYASEDAADAYAHQVLVDLGACGRAEG